MNYIYRATNIDGLKDIIKKARQVATEGIEVACAAKQPLTQLCAGVELLASNTISPDTMYMIGQMIDALQQEEEVSNFANAETCGVILAAGEVISCDNPSEL